MKRLIFLCYLIAITYSIAYGQQSINKDVKVVSEYTPNVSEATKISLLPLIDDTTTQKPSFDYKISSKKLDAEFVTQPISPATLSKEKVFYAPTSLVKLGLGTYSTVFGELYYNILKSEKYAVGLNFDHSSSFGHIKLSNDTLVKAPLHLTNGGFSARRFFKSSTLKFDLNFNRTSVEYYGLQSISPLQNYYLNGASNIPTEGAQLLDGIAQRHSVFDASLGYFKSGGDEKDDAYDATLKFSSYGNKTGVTENSVVFEGGIKHYIEAFYLEGLAKIETNALTTSVKASPLYQFHPNDRSTLCLMPRIGFIFSHADVQVGLNIYNQAGDLADKSLYIGPHLLGKVNLAEGIISIFGGASSKLNVNSYRNVAYDNNFIAPDLNVKSSYYGMNLFGGVKGNFSSKTSFIARVDYAAFTDEHFFKNKVYQKTDPTIPALIPAFDYSNRFDVIYDDGKLLTVSGEFMVKPNETFDIILSGKYYNWNLSTQQQAWYKPEYEVGIKSVFKPAEGWKVQADLLATGKRYANDINSLSPKELKANYDINVSGEYHYDQSWMFFGGIYNLLASKYYKWNEYPEQGINFRVGVGFTF